MTTETKEPHEKPFPSWYHQLHTLSRAAEDTRKEANKMRQRGRAIRIQADGLAKFSQLDINNRLSDRINCLRLWYELLEETRANLCDVMKRLSESKTQTDQFLARLADAITVNVECVTYRDTRRGREYVEDPVQDELRKEARMQLEIRTMLQSSIDDALEQLRILTGDLHDLMIQMREKEEARNLDIEQYNRNEKSGQIGFKPFCMREEEGSIDLQTWEDLGRELVAKCRTDMLKGIAMYERLYDEMHQAANRLNDQSDSVAEKLRRRIFEQKTAIRELEYQKSELEKERERMLHDLRSWHESKNAKIASLKLSQTRMETRHDRPGIENEKDAPYYGLREESKTLNDVIDGLDEQIGKGREHLGFIEDRIALLCEDIQSKKSALFVDENVVGVRKRLEKPMEITHPPCDMVPSGLLRQQIKFY